METMIFENRREGGRQLAIALAKRGYKGQNTLVLGIPRGGLVVAEEVARALSAVLDIVIARKIRAPYQPELGIGAVVNGDHVTINEDLSCAVGATQGYLTREIAYLLIVGEEDRSVIPLNELAYKKLVCPKEMVVVPGATHLFEEPGALERVGQLARDWFLKYFADGAR
jgi:phosphoribosyl transferase-like protein